MDNETNTPPAISETQNLPQISQQPLEQLPPSHSPVWLIILLFLTIQPAAIAMIWKDKYYHKFFAYILWFYALLLFLTIVSLIFFVLPRLNTLYSSLNTGYDPTSTTLSLFLLFFILIVQFIFGFMIMKKIKTAGLLTKTFLVISVLFIILDTLAPAIVMEQIISPIYQMTSLIR